MRFLQAINNNTRSSSERYRTLPLGSLSFDTLRRGLSSIHSHSFTAVVIAVLNAALYRFTRAFVIYDLRLVILSQR